MYKEQERILNLWEEFLKEITSKMESSIKEILDEVLNNKDIFAIFFEYEYDDMDIIFYAMDRKENALLRKLNMVIDKLNCNHLFPKELSDKQMELNNRYDSNDDNYEEYIDEYSKIKEDIFKNWFKKCWDNIKNDYNNIPKAYFSIHDTNWKTDLETKERIKYSEIMK